MVKPGQTDLAVAIPEILNQNPSALVLADVGRLPADVYDPLQAWINRGGTLIRFAGPRLAAAPADDPLVPVILRQGERALGGALSWAEPQPLADFPTFGPFAGMPRPEGILVKRQVLAEPTPDLAARTWASLADGTPLVTVEETGAGRIVLFHVSAEATWSDLPISGTFVEMLRRIVQLTRVGAAEAAGGQATAPALPPFRLLNERGALTAEAGAAKPLSLGPTVPRPQPSTTRLAFTAPKTASPRSTFCRPRPRSVHFRHRPADRRPRPDGRHRSDPAEAEPSDPRLPAAGRRQPDRALHGRRVFPPAEARTSCCRIHSGDCHVTGCHHHARTGAGAVGRCQAR